MDRKIVGSPENEDLNKAFGSQESDLKPSHFAFACWEAMFGQVTVERPALKAIDRRLTMCRITSYASLRLSGWFLVGNGGIRAL